jgi:hypothetical protein
MSPDSWVYNECHRTGVCLLTKNIDKPEMKKDPFEKINPNGRAPAIEDPNTGVTVWESVAIIEYLVETYDKELVFTYTTCPEKWQMKQWLYFQVRSPCQLALGLLLLRSTLLASRCPVKGHILAKRLGSSCTTKRRSKVRSTDISRKSSESSEFWIGTCKAGTISLEINCKTSSRCGFHPTSITL